MASCICVDCEYLVGELWVVRACESTGGLTEDVAPPFCKNLVRPMG